MGITTIIEEIGRAIDVAGVVVIAGGIAWISLSTLLRLRGQRAVSIYDEYRRGIGRAILLGLELLVAADIIRTVAVEPTLEAVAALGLVVLIRTFLSFSLEVELYGRWPWQRAPEPPKSGPDPGDL